MSINKQKVNDYLTEIESLPLSIFPFTRFP